MTNRVHKVLFRCTGHSARAMLAESILRKDRAERCDAAFRYLKIRISLFTALPIGSLDSLALGAKLRAIGQAESSTDLRGTAA